MAYVKKTNYKSIYQDDKTGNYGVKYNYKVYNPITKKMNINKNGFTVLEQLKKPAKNLQKCKPMA